MNTSRILIIEKQDICKSALAGLKDARRDYLFVAKDNVADGLDEIRLARFEAVVIGADIPAADVEQILYTVTDVYGSEFPVIIVENVESKINIKADMLTGSHDKISSDCGFAEALDIALSGAIERRKLKFEKRLLKLKIVENRADQKISETALQYGHRINNSLTTILGQAQLLLRNCHDDDRTRQRLKKIEEAAFKIQKITLSLANGFQPHIDDTANRRR